MTEKRVFTGVYAFAVIGVVGFIVDASVLTLYMALAADGSPLIGRFFSFPIAVTVTWYLNRRYTFPVKKCVSLYREWGRYIIVNSFGFFINFSVFLLIMIFSISFHQYPLIVLGLASLVAMFVNYLGSRLWVFENSSISEDQ